LKSDNNQNIISFSNFAKINPFRKIPNGKEVKFVSMEDVEAGRKFVTRYSIREFKGGSKFRNGDTLMARITPSLEHGKTAFVNFLNEGEVGGGSTEFIVLSNREGVSLSEYVYYLAISSIIREPAIKSMSGTSGRQRVDPDIFEQIQVPAPDLDEQQAIVKILSDLDEKIELNNQMNKTLEDIAQAIFKRWFIDFEFPNENGEPYKSSGGEMVESELGMIPMGWYVDNLGKYVEVVKGCSYSSIDLKPSDTALVTLKSINRGGGFNRNGYKEYVGKYKDNQIVKEGDILLAQTDLTQNGDVIGRPAFFHGETTYSKVIASLDLQIIRHLNGFSKYFVFYLLDTDSFHEHALSHTNGTTVLHLDRNAVSEFRCIIPKNDILDQFDAVVSQILSLENNNLQEINYLTEIRDLLLPKLMTGKIRVPLEGQNVE